MNTRAYPFRRLLTAIVFVGLTASAFSAQDSRTAFRKLLERPRVALAPQIAAPTTENGITTVAFSFATEANQRVPGLLVTPDVPGQSSSAARRPVVIALHGTGGNKESQLPLLSDYAHNGFIGVAIDGRYHGARSKTGKGSADYNDAIAHAFSSKADAEREYPFFFDTAWDVMRLIDYLVTRDDVDPARIGVIGFSKGGIETYLAAAADPRIAVAVPCIGVQSFRWALDHNAWQPRVGTIKSSFDAAASESSVAQPDAAFVRTFYQRVAPGIDGEFDGPAMLPLIAPRPLLVINGELDDRTPLPGLAECADAAQAAYKAAGAENKFVLHIQSKAGHTVTPASLALAKAWFTYWLRGQAAE